MTALAPLLQAYFIERLARQRDASPHTIASYRDSFRLLLTFLHEQTGTPPSKLQLEDLNPDRITAFLSHLENERSNSVRTRNARLTAIHSFFQFAALKAPERSEQIARVLSIPEKRYRSTLINYLTKREIDALLAAPDRSTLIGRRDHALLLLAVQTGLRASELASLRCQDLNLDTGAWVRCEGKGRKERCTPLTRGTVKVLRVWLRELGGDPVRSAVPQPHRRAPHSRRDLAAGRQAHRDGPRSMSIPGREEHHPAHAAAYRSDATPPRRTPRRYRHDRALARARNARHHQQVPARRHGPQTTGRRPHDTPERQARTVPPTRPTAHVPREPLTPRNMLRPRTRSPPRAAAPSVSAT